ncbi:MAG: 1-deoxy-D-xylulose-5-phosphate reductoisomerase, partial [Lachnospiraceae bacterium]|nr:1-deoxy-D-xylulose-5-phosphate reductoisomerase [Lachnospiraceae bacterium]
GSMPTAFNAANEKAVAMFLDKKIPFLAIWDIISYCMKEHHFKENPNLSEILATEQEVYDIIESRW